MSDGEPLASGIGGAPDGTMLPDEIADGPVRRKGDVAECRRFRLKRQAPVVIAIVAFVDEAGIRAG